MFRSLWIGGAFVVAAGLAVGDRAFVQAIPDQLSGAWGDLKRSAGLASDDGRAQSERPTLPHGRRITQADIAGVASVIDGDTIEIHGRRIRLHGIDAPESGQTCLDGIGREWRCGQQAALVLQELLGRRTVTCHQRDIDRYGRFVGQCFVGAVDVNEWLVAQGLALAYRRYSRNYVAAEDEARQARFGMWAGTFEPPWEWRRRR